MSSQPTPKLDIRSTRRIRLAVYTSRATTPADWWFYVVRECDFCSAKIQDRRVVGSDEPPAACPACQVTHYKALAVRV